VKLVLSRVSLLVSHKLSMDLGAKQKNNKASVGDVLRSNYVDKAIQEAAGGYVFEQSDSENLSDAHGVHSEYLDRSMAEADRNAGGYQPKTVVHKTPSDYMDKDLAAKLQIAKPKGKQQTPDEAKAAAEPPTTAQNANESANQPPNALLTQTLQYIDGEFQKFKDQYEQAQAQLQQQLKQALLNASSAFGQATPNENKALPSSNLGTAEGASAQLRTAMESKSSEQLRTAVDTEECSMCNTAVEKENDLQTAVESANKTDEQPESMQQQAGLLTAIGEFGNTMRSLVANMLTLGDNDVRTAVENNSITNMSS
jgi:hypothetical protein